jgi:hypothetical protein
MTLAKWIQQGGARIRDGQQHGHDEESGVRIRRFVRERLV